MRADLRPQAADTALAAATEWAETFGVPIQAWDWSCEHRLVSYQLNTKVYELLELVAAVERPADLHAHVQAAELDEAFDADYDE